MLTSSLRRKQDYLLISDFDQTLSHNDSGVVLSEMLGISDFRQRVAGKKHRSEVVPRRAAAPSPPPSKADGGG